MENVAERFKEAVDLLNLGELERASGIFLGLQKVKGSVEKST